MEMEVIYLTGVLGLGILAQWLAWRLRLPAILLLLVFGVLFGQLLGYLLEQQVDAKSGQESGVEEVIDPELLFPIVSLSVAVIMFEGGLSLRVRELREAGRAVLGLVTVGIAVTWLLTTVAARWLLGFEPSMAVLLGALLVVSGPTVIMPLLRQVRPDRRVGAIVKWEGILNDPIGAIAAFLIFYAIASGQLERPVLHALGALVVFIAVGAVYGLLIALAFVQILKRFWIPSYLHNAAFLTAVLATFTASNLTRPESGLVAVTVFGIILANQKAVTVGHVIEFKENLRVLLISCLFVVLASRLDVSSLAELGWKGLAFVAALILVVRPAAVYLSTLGGRLPWRQRLFLAWIHPRGIVAAAVSSVFAMELLRLSKEPGGLPPGVQEDAERLAAVTFLVIVGTVTVYGLTVGPLARRLKIAEANPQGVLFAGAAPFVREIARLLHEEGYHVLLADTNRRNVAAARMAGLPTCWANVCSEYAKEELALGGIGRLLAMTPNDEVNALAAREFREVFDTAGVYQLPSKASEHDRQERLAPQRAGRLLFDPEATFGRLAARFASGAVVKKTGLGEEFDYHAFEERYGESAIVLFVIEESGELTVRTTESTAEPKPGQTLISLVDPVEQAE